jgi:hypothetical protein
MEELKTLLRSCSRKVDAQWWVGERPLVSAEQTMKIIAGKICLPTATHVPDALSHLSPINREQAARTLARAGTTSLAYGRKPPKKDDVARCKNALCCFEQTPKFFTNGSWDSDNYRYWSPLTSATFDCGVIGWDRYHAFIFGSKKRTNLPFCLPHHPDPHPARASSASGSG